ncbi:Sodium-dependent phosphate transporter 2 like, partial [Actinidia chinensis var. chinensis]
MGLLQLFCEYGYGCSRRQQKQVVVNCSHRNDHRDRSRIGFVATAAAIMLSSAANAFIEVPSQMQPETLLDIPQMLFVRRLLGRSKDPSQGKPSPAPSSVSQLASEEAMGKALLMSE